MSKAISVALGQYFETVLDVLVFWNWTNDLYYLFRSLNIIFESVEVDQLELEQFSGLLEITEKECEERGLGTILCAAAKVDYISVLDFVLKLFPLMFLVFYN